MASQHDSLIERFASIKGRIDQRLTELAPSGPPSENFNRSIRYSLLAPGKRLRPVITVLAATGLGADEQAAIDPACAIEMIHTASLMIDDLPAMDDAKTRRGQATNHRVFGEDLTILAGFALVNQAFDVISRARELDDSTRIALIRTAAEAIGMNGIIAGQERDLHGTEDEDGMAAVEQSHSLKTGALFVAAAETGVRVAGLTVAKLMAMRWFGHYLGLAYQTRDDLIDRTSTEAIACKDVRVDAAKLTFVGLVGERSAAEISRGFMKSAIDELGAYGDAMQPLASLSRMIFDDSTTSTH